MDSDTTSNGDRITRGNPITVRDADCGVIVTKIFTPKGERVELGDESGTRIRLDAIELECLSWQDHDLFTRLLRESDFAESWEGTELASDEVVAGDDEVRVSNEYSEALLRKVTVADGDALEIKSDALHYAKLLRPVEVRAVIYQDRGLFSELLNEPYGPVNE